VRIADVKVTVVSLPFTEAETWVWGRREGITNALIEVTTDEDVTGIGECPGHPAVELVRAVLEHVRDVFVGEDPLRIERLLALALSRRGLHHFRHAADTALGGLEIALWDIVGKVAGQPLVNLFGGPVRDRIDYYRYIPMAASEEMATEAADGVAEGFGTIYLKSGFERRKDVADVAAARDAIGPAAKLRIDANEAWSPAEAIAISRELEPYDLEFVEQPISMYDLEGLARVRRATPIPVAANQAAWLEFDVLEIVRRRAADVIVTCPHQLPGLLAFKKVAGLCEVAGLPIIKHSFGDLGVTTFAAAHVLATLPNATLANQTHYNLLKDDVIAGGPPEFAAGSLGLPDGAGIGVELDPEKVALYEELYQREGEFSVYGPVAERHVS
jgi:L-alanine-DL-glutamate epimerase-like enolase superfamily enzyme